MTLTLKDYQISADYIKEKMPFKPELGIVLGTGLAPLAQEIENPVKIDYKNIPNFLISTAPGHAGELIFGEISGKKVVCMSGRFHSYEGYTFEQLSIPIRVLKLLGIEKLILTNAAGGVREDFEPGDIMLITDHIKLTGDSPMRGLNIEEFGSRFFDISNMYDKDLQVIAKKCAQEEDLDLKEGVYMFFTGPQFETVAEVRVASILGASAVGMSTVTEALTAAHAGIPVLAFSLITNAAAGVKGKSVDHEEVEEVGRRSGEKFSSYIKRVIKNI